MRYRDIKLAESTAAAREICRGLKVAIERNRNNPDSRTLSMMKQQTVKFLRQFPELKGEIDACLGIPGGVDGVLDGTSVSNAFRGNGGPNGRGEIPRGTITIPGTGTEFGASSDADSSVDDGSSVSGNSDTSGAETGGTSAALMSAAKELERFLDNEDWQGAKNHINNNPELKAIITDQNGELLNDLDAAIQAQDEAKAAGEAADSVKDDQAMQDANIAADIETARTQAAQASGEEVAAEVKSDTTAADTASTTADDARKEAERLETEREGSSTGKPSDEEPDIDRFDASDWGGDETLERFPVEELRAARRDYYANLEADAEIFFDADGNVRDLSPAEARQLDALERERRQLLNKYGRGILKHSVGSVTVTPTGSSN